MYTPHLDVGDYVVVINAEKVALTGRKARAENVLHTLRLYGAREAHPVSENDRTHPDRVIELAVKGMLPKNKLGQHMRKKLKVYAGVAHPHQGQEPQPLEV